MTQRRHQGYLEPQSVLVNIRDDGRIDVWLCSKVPYNTRESLATAARLPEENFIFHHVYIGGDFGGKGNSRNTPVAYYLAKAHRAAGAHRLGLRRGVRRRQPATPHRDQARRRA